MELVWWVALAFAWLIVALFRSLTRPGTPQPAPKPLAEQWQELLDRAEVVIVDVATTGTGPRSEVLEVAAVDTTGRVLIDALAMPEGRITTAASDVHGLTRGRLRSLRAPPWPVVHDDRAPYRRWKCSRGTMAPPRQHRHRHHLPGPRVAHGPHRERPPQHSRAPRRNPRRRRPPAGLHRLPGRKHRPRRHRPPTRAWPGQDRCRRPPRDGPQQRADPPGQA